MLPQLCRHFSQSFLVVELKRTRQVRYIYDSVAASECDEFLTGTLAGVTLTPGVYCFAAEAALTGTLTLAGPSNASWLFKVGTLGTGALTGTDFNVVMANGGTPCNVTWWVAEAATLTDSNFIGTILAGAADAVTRGTFEGRTFSKAFGLAGIAQHLHEEEHESCSKG